MFSGIIATLGTITRIEPLGDGMRLFIDVSHPDFDDVKVGDSIAVNGVCLTVIEQKLPQFSVDVSAETIRCTTGFTQGQQVNLERALQLSSRLDGHIVIGHVDGVGTIKILESISESWHLIVEAPATLARYIANKGSIAVNGVSLTTNTVNGCDFEINLIPHTYQATTFHQLKVGDKVNLEIDLFARYIERMISVDEPLGANT